MKKTTLQNRCHYLTLIAASIILFILISAIGGISFQFKLIIGSFCYFLFTFSFLLFYTKINKTSIFTIIVLPPLLVLIFINILNFKGTWSGLPSSFFIFLGCLMGYLSSKKTFIYFFIVLVFLNITWISFGRIPYENKMQYGSITKKVFFKAPSFVLYDTANKTIGLNNEKITILDFWNSKCAPCYSLFPIIDSVNKTMDTSKYEIFSVNIPLMNEKIFDNFKLLDKYNYSFKKSFTANDSILADFDVEVFPTTIVLKDNNVIYRGDFVSAIEFLMPEKK
jgi:thiol-disulfide isomerase/thioredoxin